MKFTQLFSPREFRGDLYICFFIYFASIFDNHFALCKGTFSIISIFNVETYGKYFFDLLLLHYFH